MASCKKLFYKKNLDLRMAERYKQSNPNLIPVCKKRAFNFNISISLICSKCEVFSKRNFTQCLFIVEYYLNINKKCNRVKSEIFEHCFLVNNVKLFIKVSGELFPREKLPPRLVLGFQSRLGLLLGLGCNQAIAPKNIASRLGLGFGLELVFGVWG